MKVCLVYDCLFPYTIGGAERWYRNLAERLVADGHEVTYLTLRQWPAGADPAVAGVSVRAVGPPMALYAEPGRRRVLPPLVFGVGVLCHLLRHGQRYDVVHTASFPYFSVLAAGLLRPWGRYQLVVDWHEVWTWDYWREYLGQLAGALGWLVQSLCAKLPQRAFCFSELHAARLRSLRLRGEISLIGEYAGPVDVDRSRTVQPVVLYAGRHIPEKRVPAIVPAVARARELVPELRAAILGDGPERGIVEELVSRLGLDDVIEVPGFVSAAVVDEYLARALCLVLPSRREGYGMVVIEAASHGTPSVVVAEPDNAAVELIVSGENGFVARSASPEHLAEAILLVTEAGLSLRDSTANWFEHNLPRLSIAQSLEAVVDAYAPGSSRQ